MGAGRSIIACLDHMLLYSVSRDKVDRKGTPYIPKKNNCCSTPVSRWATTSYFNFN